MFWFCVCQEGGVVCVFNLCCVYTREKGCFVVLCVCCISLCLGLYTFPTSTCIWVHCTALGVVGWSDITL